MKKILLTGASGFIGKNFIKYSPLEYEIYAIYNQNLDFPNFVKNRKNVKAYKVDLTDENSIKNTNLVTINFDVCLFLSANGDPAYSVQYPIDDLNKNTIAVLKSIEHFKIDDFIYFSSGAVYDHLSNEVNPKSVISPILPYSISKYSSERYLEFSIMQKRIKNAFSVRFFGAYGEYEADRKIYNRLVKNFGIERKNSFDIRGDGENYISAMYVKDAVDAIIKTIEYLEDKKEKFIIADLYSNEKLKISELVYSVASFFKIEPKINFFGSVPEYIEFYSNDDFYKKELNFEPKTKLKDGILGFYENIKKGCL
ncbi:hypothetical protein CRV08_10800 [Halarcobacter ebronensis]|uniref:NAD-dependent epimerase/dehydratase domain-containing protein n=1 Tax=Halarcobacter ebronensis TaxID=1462615 RepID=A0A4Q0YE73_9BACT|nr:NAD(P)-dependent oxidoreductase [Halarcobacter ebronensis]RXJ67409.1 hypothetical protein CRV08_10800 [Halarcobacter ebronensis]